jgi:inorganic pyrophosphatase
MTQARDRDTRSTPVVLGDIVRVVVQVPRGSFVKPRSGGGVDFVSPLPCPFNYGEVPGTLGADGDPLDAVLLGPRRPAGSSHSAQVQGQVRFVDAGSDDHKLVCGAQPPGPTARAAVVWWFVGYALAKRVLYLLRGDRLAASAEATHCVGWHEPSVRAAKGPVP